MNHSPSRNMLVKVPKRQFLSEIDVQKAGLEVKSGRNSPSIPCIRENL